MDERLHNDCDGGFCVSCSIDEKAAQAVDQDELNCPACEEQALMDVFAFSSDEVDEGVNIVCPSCGFQVAGRNAAQVEAAVRMLWDYGLPYAGETDCPGVDA